MRGLLPGDPTRTVSGWTQASRFGARCSSLFGEVRAAFPRQMVSPDQSSSFYQGGAGISDEERETFIRNLAMLGFCWQFRTLAGFLCDASSIDFLCLFCSGGRPGSVRYRSVPNCASAAAAERRDT